MKSPPPFFCITGTDTGVGKTCVTALLAAAIANQTSSIAVIKAVQTGCENQIGRHPAPDLAAVAEMAQWAQEDPRLILGAGFPDACSPHLAAAIQGTSISMNHLNRVVRDAMSQYDHVLMEGAGGLLVPLQEDFFFIDWLREWNAPTLLVARAGLGTINHTLLSVEAMRQRHIPLAGVVLNESTPLGADRWIAEENAAYLKRKIEAPVLHLPHRPSAADGIPLLTGLGWRA